MGQQLLPRKILVVDDNQDAAEMVAALLNANGHQAEAVFGGEAALRAVDSLSPDVIFLDIGMPGMDGYQTIAALRDPSRHVAARIVALTAWGDPDSRRRIIEAGFDMHLTKPASMDALLRELAGSGPSS